MSGLSAAPLTLDLADRRPLAALRFVSAITGLPVEEPVRISGARSVRTPRGLYVILEPDDPALARALAAYAASFPEPPAQPVPGSQRLDLRVEPAGGPWLARRLSLRLPFRPGPPDNSEDDPGAIPFQRTPQVVPLFPAANLALEPSWAALRVHVTRDASNPPRPLGGVLLHALRAPAAVPPVIVGRGQSDARGEALIALPLPPLLPGADLPRVTVQARRDNRAGALPPDPQLLADATNEPWLVVANSASIEIEPGREHVLVLEME